MDPRAKLGNRQTLTPWPSMGFHRVDCTVKTRRVSELTFPVLLQFLASFLWHWCSKNRRDGATVSSRVLTMTDTVGRKLFEGAASPDPTNNVDVSTRTMRRNVITPSKLWWLMNIYFGLLPHDVPLIVFFFIFFLTNTPPYSIGLLYPFCLQFRIFYSLYAYTLHCNYWLYIYV